MERADIGFDAPETDNSGCLLHVTVHMALYVCIETGKRFHEEQQREEDEPEKKERE